MRPRSRCPYKVAWKIEVAAAIRHRKRSEPLFSTGPTNPHDGDALRSGCFRRLWNKITIKASRSRVPVNAFRLEETKRQVGTPLPHFAHNIDDVCFSQTYFVISLSDRCHRAACQGQALPNSQSSKSGKELPCSCNFRTSFKASGRSTAGDRNIR